MLRALVRSCLEHRLAVLSLASATLVYGAVEARRAPLDVLPDFAPPQVTVQCEAPGFSPEQVETLVTTPLESALSSAGSLDSIRSQSIQGLSIITAVFEDGTDVYRARQVLSELLAEASALLPAGAAPPQMTPLSSATMDVLKFGLVSDTLDPTELRTFTDFTLAPRLRAVPGVSSVTAFGGDVRQLVVELDPARLAAEGVGVDQVLEAARRATGVRGGGFVDTPGQRIVLESRGEARTAAELAHSPLDLPERPTLAIGDVATVREGVARKVGDCSILGRPGVLVKVLGQYGANTLATTRALEAALDELAPTFQKQGIEVVRGLHRPANFIEVSIRNLGDSLWLGAVLVAVVLFLFVLDLRVAFISMTAIPLSLLAAVLVLTRLGHTLNTMTLGGLAIAIGEVVDDAIIDVENIVRRLRQNSELARPLPIRQVVLDASLEVRSSVVYATFVVILVFCPVLFLSGLAGRFFSPLGIAYIAAVLASLLVAITVTPAMAMVLLARHRSSGPPAWVRGLRRVYERALSLVMRGPRVAIGVAGALTVMSLAVVPRLGAEFLPDFREGHFVLQLSLAPGASLEETLRIGGRISRELLANPHIEKVEQQVGRTPLSEDPWGPNRSEIHIELAKLPPEVEAGVADEIRDVLARIPGIQTELLTFLGDRIGETISGETAQVAVDVFGPDLDRLDREAAEVASALRSIPGAVDVRLGTLPGLPALGIRPDRDACLAYRISPVAVLDAIETAFQGTRLGQIHEGPKVFDVVARLSEDATTDPNAVPALLLSSPAGGWVPLDRLAEVHEESTRSMILHEGGRRRQVVTCNVRGRDVASFVAQAKREIPTKVDLAAGDYLEWTGAAEEQHRARRELLLHSSLAGVGIVLLLSLAFRRPRHTFLVLANLPFAFLGGIAAVALTGGTLSMGAMVGFVTLFGITMRNSIMMVSHQDHLVRVEGEPPGRATVIRAASERLSPILMTALVTGLGLLPIALGSGSAGREIEGPMACVILGGLVSSTLLNLLLLPSLYHAYGEPSAGKRILPGPTGIE